MKKENFADLLTEIRACQHCASFLPLGPRPILSASRTSRVLIIGQAPGIRVHETGIAWNDPSGQRLREWMGISDDTFYDENKVAIVPMGFCYPGTGDSGDFPPRPECAPLWHDRLLQQLDSIRLTILLGQYSQHYVLGDRKKRNLTETVANWKTYRPAILPMPHPSPRNNRWLKKNPWFEAEVLPWLKRRISKVLFS
jgi:uracil-DNA glycosylase